MALKRLMQCFTLAALFGALLAACGAPASPTTGDSAPTAGAAAAPTAAAEPAAPTAAAEPAAPTAVAGAPGAESGAEGTPYKIGVVVDATGSAASLGASEKTAVEMVQAQLAETGITGPDGVKHDVEVIIIDSESKPETATAATTRLITQENVDVLIGGTTSGASLAMLAIATENETPFISVAAANAIVFDPEQNAVRTWIFKTPQNNNHSAFWQADYFKSLGVSNVCFLYENTSYGQDTLKSAEGLYGEAGITIAYSGAFERTDTEFPQIASVQSSGCEAVVVGALMPAAVNVTKAVRDFLPDIPIVQGHGVCNASFLQEPQAVEGVVLPCGRLLVASELPEDDPQKEVLQQFNQTYEAFANMPADAFAGYAWDAMQWAMIGLSQLEEGMDLAARRAAIRDAIETNVTDWPGASGVFTITPQDHLGIDYKALTFVRVEDGAYAYYPPEAWQQ